MTKNTLQPGDSAPSFSLRDVNGKTIRLSDYQDTYVIVAFLRYSGCPWCNLAVHRLVMEQPLLRENRCEIITFIQSSEEAIKTNIIDRHEKTPHFPIIADKRMTTYGDYSVGVSKLRGLRHHLRHIPAWVQSVRKEGFTQTSIDGDYFLAPALFLISPDSQQIIRADYDADLYDHESFTAIYDSIAYHSLYG